MPFGTFPSYFTSENLAFLKYIGESLCVFLNCFCCPLLRKTKGKYLKERAVN